MDHDVETGVLQGFIVGNKRAGVAPTLLYFPGKNRKIVMRP